jgi:hypothetical protein
MANEFSKEERVAFEDILEGFNDQLVLSKAAMVYRTDQANMARADDVIWRPQPYIIQSYDGMDQSANFGDKTQLSVPVNIGFSKSVPWTLDAKELRDALQEKRLGDAAKVRLASDINRAVLDVASLRGSLFVKRAAPAAGFDDVAQCDSIMNEQGVPSEDRYLALSSRDYNGMANNLAGRQHMGEKVSKAYDSAYVGRVCGFDTYKLDYARALALAAGGAAITIDTLVASANFYAPQARQIAGTGEGSNVDNRTQVVTVTTTLNVKEGDAFTIANCWAVHHITKQSTGQLKTFRVVRIVTGTTMEITPPIVSNQGGTESEEQYQNCVFTATANNAAITWLNTATAATNPFWQKGAIEIIPGRYAVPDAGVAIMRGSTDQGIEVVLQKQYDINTMVTKYRLDTLFGVANKAPEMSGIIMFSQP